MGRPRKHKRAPAQENRGRGRPPLKERNKRPSRLTVYVSKSFAKQVRIAAKKKSVSVSVEAGNLMLKARRKRYTIVLFPLILI